MKILFVCKHNASRSILAEAIAKQQLPNHFQISSGGSHPRGEINPRIANYLRTRDIDPSQFHSTSWEERLDFHPDLIITVCDKMHNETCPNWLSSGIRVAWDLESLPDVETPETEFNSRCDKMFTSLERRIKTLGSINFASLNDEEIKHCVSELASI